jgi:type VI secretion system protein VasD
VTANVTIAASRDVNPDANGRPSPVVVHVYQLTGDAVFNGAEFFALVDDDKKALGETLISREQYFQQPADQKSVDVNVDPKAGYLGVMAEYRDFRNANWRAVMPAPKGKLTVSVERARVAIAAAP